MAPTKVGLKALGAIDYCVHPQRRGMDFIMRRMKKMNGLLNDRFKNCVTECDFSKN